MERLLTPIVTRLLQSYVKSAQGKTGADLRVVLSGGSLALHSLELNLDPLLRKFPFLKVHRAYAERLRLVIPWTSLATQPIQVSAQVKSDRHAVQHFRPQALLTRGQTLSYRSGWTMSRLLQR